MERTITIQTGVGGMDLLNTAFEESAGFKRIRIGDKVPRILRTKKAVIRKSYKGFYYKLVGKKRMEFKLRPVPSDYELPTKGEIEKVLSEIFGRK